MSADAGLRGAPGAGAPGPVPAAGSVVAPPAAPAPPASLTPPVSAPRRSPAGPPDGSSGAGWGTAEPGGAPGSDAGLGTTRHWAPAAVARGFALFIGGFTLVSVFGSLRYPQADFAIWWVAVPVVGRVVTGALLAVFAAALLAYAVAPRMRPWRRWPTIGLVLAFAAVTAWNGADFYLAWRDGEMDPGVPVPLSFVVCAVLVFIAWAALRPPSSPPSRSPA